MSEIRLVAIHEDQLTELRGHCSVCGRRVIVNGEDDYHLISHKPSARLIPSEYRIYELPADAWDAGITEEEALRLAKLADNWLDEYADERYDPDVAKLRSAFRKEPVPEDSPDA